MKYFDKFKSNTYAGSGNQLFFNMNEKKYVQEECFIKYRQAVNIIIQFCFQTL